jgi:hypothetical protein
LTKKPSLIVSWARLIRFTSLQSISKHPFQINYIFNRPTNLYWHSWAFHLRSETLSDSLTGPYEDRSHLCLTLYNTNKVGLINVSFPWIWRFSSPRGLRVCKSPGPNGIPNRVLGHLPKRAITFLTKVFNAVLHRQYFPSAWKHDRVVSILNPGKDPTLPFSYRPISLLDTISKLFESILFTRVLRDVSARELLRDEQFGFRPRHSTTQLARLVERVNSNFDERRLTGAFFLDVAKAFHTVWVKGLLYKVTILNFLSYLVKTISSYLDCRTFEMSFQSATSTRRACGLVWCRVNSSPRCCSVCMWTTYPHTPRHVELAQYADDTALVATSRNISLVVGYLEAYLGRLEHWLRDWRIAINVSKSTVVLFVEAARRVQNPEQCSFSESPYSGSKQHGILGRLLTHSLPGLRTSTR